MRMKTSIGLVTMMIEEIFYQTVMVFLVLVLAVIMALSFIGGFILLLDAIDPVVDDERWKPFIGGIALWLLGSFLVAVLLV